MFAAWLGAMIYTVTYCYLHGYGRTKESLKFVLGFPDWVFWGIVLPWGLCTIVASLFAFFFMKDEDLDGIGAPATNDVQGSGS